jgi:hypothetical protein
MWEGIEHTTSFDTLRTGRQKTEVREQKVAFQSELGTNPFLKLHPPDGGCLFSQLHYYVHYTDAELT